MVEPAVGMAVDEAGAFAVRDDIAHDDVANHPRWRLIGLQWEAEALAAALDREVDGITVAPPEPVKPVGMNDHVRDDDVFDNAAVIHHEGEAAIGVGDDHVVNGDVPVRPR